jgi:hypothetical protein
MDGKQIKKKGWQGEGNEQETTIDRMAPAASGSRKKKNSNRKIERNNGKPKD